MADKQSHLDSFSPGSPVRTAPGDKAPVDGVGLCLSGGGYRAMLFHTGLLIRLNEAAILPTIDRVSAVSGGSIAAGVLAANWENLVVDGGVARNFDELVVNPLRRVANSRIDVGAVLSGIALPFVSISDRVGKKLDNMLFHGVTLQDLPDEPRLHL